MKGLMAVLVFSSGGVWAMPACRDGPLAWYLALDSTGCKLQMEGVTYSTPVTFRSFTYTADPQGIEAAPAWAPWAPGMSFSGFAAPPGSDLDAWLTYEIDAPATSVTLEAGNPVVPMHLQGSVCIGAPFADGGSCSTGQSEALSADSRPVTFSATDVLGVSDHIVLDGAAAASFGNQISKPDGYGSCQCATVGGEQVPEPSAGWLLGTGIVLLGLAACRK